MFINLFNILYSKGILSATTKQAPNTTISLSVTKTMGQGNRFTCHLFEYDGIKALCNRLVGLYQLALFFIIRKLLTVLLHTFHSMMIQLKRLSRGLLPGTKTGIFQDLQLEKSNKGTTGATSNGPCVKGGYLAIMLVFGTCIIKR